VAAGFYKILFFTAKGQEELHRNRMLKKFFNNVIWKIKLKKEPKIE